MAEAEEGREADAHQPVMVREVVEYLACRPGQTIVDATVGSGGHAEAILKCVSPGGRVIGIDRDPEAIERTRRRLAGKSITLVNDNYSRLGVILDEQGVAEVDGVLIDCGASWEQLTVGRRGFSFREEGPLDMRMDPRQESTAADLVNTLPEEELARILWEFGGERRARSIARAIARARQQHRISTTTQLAALVTAAVPARAQPKRLHAATKTFMALRIAVNDEIGALRTALETAIDRTKSGGRIAVLTYQSLEGGETKRVFRRASDRSTCSSFPSEEPCLRVRILTKRAVKPSPEEIGDNPRARSALLRVAEKL
jgi:16S rRNA (cytosine1402-N4)-methyltransferase